jgi:uncharacterized membrane protein (DUF106 family)
MAVFDFFYSFLDLLFNPVFNISAEKKVSYMVGIFFVSALIAFITTLVTSKVIDQDEMKQNKKKLKEFQEKVKRGYEKLL